MSDESIPEEKFSVPHRPERHTPTPDTCLWGECQSENVSVVRATASNGDTMRTQLCPKHIKRIEENGTTVKFL